MSKAEEREEGEHKTPEKAKEGTFESTIMRILDETEMVKQQEIVI